MIDMTAILADLPEGEWVVLDNTLREVLFHSPDRDKAADRAQKELNEGATLFRVPIDSDMI